MLQKVGPFCSLLVTSRNPWALHLLIELGKAPHTHSGTECNHFWPHALSENCSGLQSGGGQLPRPSSHLLVYMRDVRLTPLISSEAHISLTVLFPIEKKIWDWRDGSAVKGQANKKHKTRITNYMEAKCGLIVTHSCVIAINSFQSSRRQVD